MDREAVEINEMSVCGRGYPAVTGAPDSSRSRLGSIGYQSVTS